MDSNFFEMNFIVVEAIRGRCASFTVLTATVWKIFGGLTNSSILVLYNVFIYISIQLIRSRGCPFPAVVLLFLYFVLITQLRYYDIQINALTI